MTTEILQKKNVNIILHCWLPIIATFLFSLLGMWYK